MPTILPSVATHVMVTGSLSASEEQDTLNAGGGEREEEEMRKGERGEGEEGGGERTKEGKKEGWRVGREGEGERSGREIKKIECWPYISDVHVLCILYSTQSPQNVK